MSTEGTVTSSGIETPALLAIFIGGCALTWLLLTGRIGGRRAGVLMDVPAAVVALEEASEADRHEEVIALEAEAMASIPEWAAEWRTTTAQNVGRSYWRLNRPFEAIDAKERALAELLDPAQRADVHSSLVALHHRVGQRTRAREHGWSFAQIVASGLRAPRLPFDHLCVTMFMAGCATEDGDDVDRHIVTATTIAEQHPDDVEIRLLTSFGLAELALNRHEPETALAHIERDLPFMLEVQQRGGLPVTIHPAFPHLFLAEAQARSGRPVTPLQPAHSYGRAVSGPDSLIPITEHRTHGFVALAVGDVEGAATSFHRGMAQARSIQHPTLESTLAYHHALALHRQGIDAGDEIALARRLAESLGQTARLRDLDAAMG
jgi:hypothetical protein